MLKMNVLHGGLLLFCLGNLVACNSNGPRQDGLLSSVHSLQTGAYDARLQVGRNRLEQLRQQHNHQQKQLDELNKKVAVEARRMQRLRNTVQVEQSRKARHLANIRKLTSRQQDLRRELAVLEKSLKMLDQQARAKAFKSRQQAKSPGQLTRERDELRMQLQSLINKGI